MGFYLTGSQAHDWEGVDKLLSELEAEALLADCADDADERVRQQLEAKGQAAVIPFIQIICELRLV